MHRALKATAALLRGRTLRTGLRIAAALILAFLAAFVWLDARYPFPMQSLARDPAVAVLDREGEPLRMFLPRDELWRFPVTLDEVSPTLVNCFLASEDRRFERHPGVDPLAVLRAAMTNVFAGRVVSGGSTITMQLARLAQPKERTLANKLVEAFRALQLERSLNKEQILEHYLNMTPYGGNIVGVGAAAYFYFGTTPERLTLEQSALLTILPRAPNAFDPFRHPERARAARDRFLDTLAERGVYSRERVEAAKNQPLPRALHRAPMIAPHFCRLAADQYPDRERIETTIDRDIQLIAEAQLHERIGWLRNLGLENAAVVVIDTESRELLAMVGSAEFFDDEHHGQINGALISRSPGSALKPFLYALAMDQGLISPESMLLDLPTEYAGYSPRNYDEEFSGRVTVTEALRRSLNIPAVRLLHDVGVDPFLSLLRSGGLRTLNRDAGGYGLPLALGACEVRLMDLAGLYATLADGGEYREVHYTPGADLAGERILSRESCWLVTTILTEVERSDMPAAWHLTRDVPEVAWKTGTSFGHRDAWALGFSGRYTIGVWVGNLDGRAQKGISGARHAGPILFDLFRALERGGSHIERPFPLNIQEIQVCSESRDLPTPLCEDRTTARIIPGVTHLQRDTMHQRVFLDAESGLRLEGDCLLGREHTTEIVLTYPAELVAWWRSQGMAVQGLPPLDASCAVIPEQGGPSIVSPNPLTPYMLRADAPAEFQRIALSAQCSADTRDLYWYQDGVLVASGAPDEQLFLMPDPGEHRVVVMDDRGRMDVVQFSVE